MNRTGPAIRARTLADDFAVHGITRGPWLVQCPVCCEVWSSDERPPLNRKEACDHFAPADDYSDPT